MFLLGSLVADAERICGILMPSSPDALFRSEGWCFDRGQCDVDDELLKLLAVVLCCTRPWTPPKPPQLPSIPLRPQHSLLPSHFRHVDVNTSITATCRAQTSTEAMSCRTAKMQILCNGASCSIRSASSSAKIPIVRTQIQGPVARIPTFASDQAEPSVNLRACT